MARDPYPHLVQTPALDPSLYSALIRELPDIGTMLGERQLQANGQCFCDASRVLGNSNFSPLWQEFFAYHTSGLFFRKFCSIFGDVVEESHPHLLRRVGKPLGQFATNIRHVEPMADIALDCQFVYNAPGHTTKLIRGPHLDRPVALYAGLLYLRYDDDDARGGDFELYRFKSVALPPECDGSLPLGALEQVATVAYRPNTLVMFPHSRMSVHGVSPRQSSTRPRLHVNLLGEVATPLSSE